MSDTTTLLADIREVVGTGSSRALRRTGMVPATLYGADKKPMSITILEKDITKLYRKHGFTSTVIQLEIGGKKHKVLPKSIELHPVTDIVRHVDFVYLDSKIQKVSVPIVFEGKERSLGVKRGGFFNIICRKITLLCPVNAIPQDITIDVVSMGVGMSLRTSQLKLPQGCSLVAKNDVVIASITGRGGKEDTTDAGATPAA
ncbi:MAG: 50S ribosomal protein L25/general stress protein Ctc [Pseudomonadota bacterium]